MFQAVVSVLIYGYKHSDPEAQNTVIFKNVTQMKSGKNSVCLQPAG